MSSITNSIVIELLDFTENQHPYGKTLGLNVFQKLKHHIDIHSEFDTFIFSLQDIIATDVVFPRESIVSLVKLYQGKKYFCLVGINDNQDLFDNLSHAAAAKNQLLTVWDSSHVRFIGSKLTIADRDLLNYIAEKKEVTTTDVYKQMDITAQNASTRLKTLFNRGYIYRVETTSDSGGKKFIYSLIGGKRE